MKTKSKTSFTNNDDNNYSSVPEFPFQLPRKHNQAIKFTGKKIKVNDFGS